MHIRFLLIIAICMIAGCETIPKDALTFTPESLGHRQLQTRRFDTADERKILQACAGLLQDTGFNIDETERGLGLIVGSKERSAVDAGQQIAAIGFAALTGVSMATDRNQRMRASVVTRPFGDRRQSMTVRVTFQRIVWNTENNISKQEALSDPDIYQEFFAKLSKAVFLEAHSL